MANFVVVVDGEVAGNIPVPEPVGDGSDMSNAFEKMIAALSSNPQIIKHDRVESGWLWDGQKFIPPVE